MSEGRAAEMQQAMDASPTSGTPAFSRHAASLKLQVGWAPMHSKDISSNLLLFDFAVEAVQGLTRRLSDYFTKAIGSAA